MLPFATTGIASTLMPGGRTAHSGFGLPVPMLDTSISHIQHGIEKGKALVAADLIIIDEITMLNKDGLRVINELLQRLMKNRLHFGGKAIVLSGDFRQTLPVIKGATRAGVIEAYLKSSPLWQHFIQLSLISNMRSEGRSQYNEWLLNVGSGNTTRIPLLKPEAVEIPRNMVLNAEENIITSTFTENLQNLSEDELAERVILCATNREALEINNEIIENLPGEMKIYNSADSLISDDEFAATIYTEEFLHELQPSGMPPHELRLKRGAIVIGMRDFIGMLSRRHCIYSSNKSYAIGY